MKGCLLFLIFLGLAQGCFSQEFNCLPNPILSCGGHGVCLPNGTFGFECKCDNNYDNQGCPQNVQCCNELQSRTKVFLVAFFVGWTGAPYYMIGNIGAGVGLLLMFFGGLYTAVICKAVYENDLNNTVAGAFMMIGALAYVGAVCWYIAVWIMVAAETGPFDRSKIGAWI
jgi:hypothetical protein